MSASLTADDLVYYTDKENNIYSGGFNVHSILMKEGISPLTFLPISDGGNVGGGNSDDIFKDLVVPGWAATLAVPSYLKGGAGAGAGATATATANTGIQTDEPITLYDKLLDLVATTNHNKVSTKRIKTYRRRNHNKPQSYRRKKYVANI